MKTDELKAMTDEELGLSERNTAEALWKLRFQQNTGQLTNTAELNRSKKTRARILTIQQERELGISSAPGASEKAAEEVEG